MSTEHEARARRAKAVALATVLAEVENVTDPTDVRAFLPITWELAAKIATERGLLGQDSRGRNRQVHVPHSAETVAAVERELRIMQVEQRVDVEQPQTGPGWRYVETERGGETFTRREVIADPRYGEPRQATDSAGYRQEMRRLVPAPNTSDPFAGFPR